MAGVVIVLPERDVDPTETGVPWRVLTGRGHEVVFATPDGRPAEADPRMVTGEGLGLFAPLLKADRNGRGAHDAMIASDAFRRPIPYGDVGADAFDALLLPGGHAKGMRPYLESERLFDAIAGFFAREKPVAAICHGVLLAARARGKAGKSVLHGRKTTGLPRLMELGAWALTGLYLGDYYRTYRQTVEDEVRGLLARPEDFIRGPLSLARDAPGRLERGFTVRDGSYLSARWPGDAHRFADELASMLERPNA
ncbi:MAG TPA: type 1 glutamine amidotransferase domain-containing protein [Stellaceae bacterium]|nr:type 1 glutamine amidotransferase domain-containing protein [Stellaceae bacterium]